MYVQAMEQDQKHYQALLQISRETSHLKGISHLLDWDKETYMPPGASLVRAEQAEIMASLIHKGETGKPFVSALSKLIDIDSGKLLAKSLSPAQKSAVMEWRREYLKQAKLPEKFVKAFAKLTTEATHEWAIARKNNQFNAFAPFLERIIEMVREKAELWGYKKHPYDALLDEFEPHATKEEISTLFTGLRPPIIQLIKKIKTAPQVDNSFLLKKISHQKQMKFALQMIEAVGYDRQHGRLDLSAHPFSSSLHPHDNRITTRVSLNGIMDNLGACLHEFGHSLYEMNLPPEHFGSPLCEAVSLGLHESQSRWWETRIGQNKSFWAYFYPILQKQLRGLWEGISLEAFYRAINRVEPSFIRVEADEVTYTLHVILRFEIECALIEGALKPADIPSAWNAKMKEYFGITPRNDAEGCLQDIHWSMGAFGYFPTYSLGNLYTSHFFSAFEKAHPSWEKKIALGEFGFIRDWLKTEIHQYGKRYSSSELAKKVTGSPLTSDAFVHYLQNKYREIYKL